MVGCSDGRRGGGVGRSGVLQEREVGRLITLVGDMEEVGRRELFNLLVGILPRGGYIPVKHLLRHSEGIVLSVLCHNCHLSEQLLLVLVQCGYGQGPVDEPLQLPMDDVKALLFV